MHCTSILSHGSRLSLGEDALELRRVYADLLQWLRVSAAQETLERSPESLQHVPVMYE